ncbi:MAG: alpha-glucosidase, partial [Myxococcales bacterium]|nr:alpha-glucosidase [Myxococcales bacterium]
QFPEDPDSRGISDEFMLGDQVLVAPVVSEGASSREVYLPPGAWKHALTGEAFEGGQRVTVEAPIGTPPVFVTSDFAIDLASIR